jgi:His/Glu/Gln/Arg/opine family amino acid ABC transporter permease subunit
MQVFYDLALRYFPYIVGGALTTVELTVLALAISVVLGLVAAFCKRSVHVVFRVPATIYIEVLRGTPALLQIFIVYFGLTSFGLKLDPLPAAVITLGLMGGAYLAEVFRAGIESVDRGQIEAAISLGMRPANTMRRIVLPQAMVVTWPPFTNFVVGLIKDTSLALTITVPEIMYRSYDAASQSFRSMEIYSMAGVIYLAICYPLSRVAKHLESKRPPR